MLLATHLRKNRAHVIHAHALTLLDEDFSVLWTDHDVDTREQFLQKVLQVFEIPRSVYDTAASPRQFTIELQMYVHRLKVITARDLAVGVSVVFQVPHHDVRYVIKKIKSDFLLELHNGRIAHPLWVTRS